MKKKKWHLSRIRFYVQENNVLLLSPVPPNHDNPIVPWLEQMLTLEILVEWQAGSHLEFLWNNTFSQACPSIFSFALHFESPVKLEEKHRLVFKFFSISSLAHKHHKVKNLKPYSPGLWFWASLTFPLPVFRSVHQQHHFRGPCVRNVWQSWIFKIIIISFFLFQCLFLSASLAQFLTDFLHPSLAKVEMFFSVPLFFNEVDVLQSTSVDILCLSSCF